MPEYHELPPEERFLMTKVRMRTMLADLGPPDSPDRAIVDDCVRTYLACSSSALLQSRGESRFFGASEMRGESPVQFARRIYTVISRARLFCIRPHDFLRAYAVADQFSEQLVDSAWLDNQEFRAASIIDSLHDLGLHWPFPGPLPFDAIFLCYGSDMHVRDMGLSGWSRTSPGLSAQIGCTDMYFSGHLLWMEGEVGHVATFLTASYDGKKSSTPMFMLDYYDGQWHAPINLDPWLLETIIRTINTHSVVDSWPANFAHKLDRKSRSGSLKVRVPLPAPFYLLNLRDEIFVSPQSFDRSGLGRSSIVQWSHRWDVRGHEVVRIISGELPLDDVQSSKLKKRGYRIYHERITDIEDVERCARRGVSGGPGIWVAVLSFWRDAFVKGPVGKPYVPAARIIPP